MRISGSEGRARHNTILYAAGQCHVFRILRSFAELRPSARSTAPGAPPTQDDGDFLFIVPCSVFRVPPSVLNPESRLTSAKPCNTVRVCKRLQPVRSRARLVSALRQGSATIRDVAAEAGVSTATVSRALNRSGVVHEETSRKVVDAANVLRYTPHAIARSLSTRRTQTLGVVLPDLHGEFFSELIRGIDRAARQSGYHLLLSGAHSDREEMNAVLAAMRGRVDGLIVMAPDVEVDSLLTRSETPVVFINSAGRSGIVVDNYGGARAMTRHLAQLGHRRIAFIKGPRANFDARERLKGYREELKSLRVARRQDLEIAGDFSEESGSAAVRMLLEAPEPPTAIFSANDEMAIGALLALREAGFLVPRDMALAGFDDIPLARYVTPPLTTVSVAIAELGRRAFEQLFEIVGNGSEKQRRDIVPTRLVIRDSCGASRGLKSSKNKNDAPPGAFKGQKEAV